MGQFTIRSVHFSSLSADSLCRAWSVPVRKVRSDWRASETDQPSESSKLAPHWAPAIQPASFSASEWRDAIVLCGQVLVCGLVLVFSVCFLYCFAATCVLWWTWALIGSYSREERLSVCQRDFFKTPVAADRSCSYCRPNSRISPQRMHLGRLFCVYSALAHASPC